MNAVHSYQSSSTLSLPLTMVFVNSKKFAWCCPFVLSSQFVLLTPQTHSESCIKGHRSSSCHHTDRPLFEVKKKGRPVSQCSKCRELRQSKKLHSKCTCDPRDRMTQEQLIPLSAGSKCRFTLILSTRTFDP